MSSGALEVKVSIVLSLAYLSLSAAFHTCTPTYQALASNLLGLLSITAWLFAQLPQIWKNYSLKSTSGLSIFFLAEWCLGDLGNLLGALFTNQAKWQVAVGIYYVFVDICLLSQWIWYEKWKHGHHLLEVKTSRGGGEEDDRGNADIASRSTSQSNAATNTDAAQRPIFRAPTFRHNTDEAEKMSNDTSSTSGSSKVYRVGPSSPLPSPSPRTVMLIACVIAIASASPLKTSHPLEDSNGANDSIADISTIGTVLSWMSTVLYLGSRLPQIFKNWQRKSTAGLSPYLFLAAFCGNLFYSAAIAANPCAWSDFESYGGHGWVGSDGSNRAEWVSAALPFFLGAAGVLVLDATVGLQFLLYSERPVRVVVVESSAASQWKWIQVSGWMRGWSPSISQAREEEARQLLEHDDQHGEGYGTLH